MLEAFSVAIVKMRHDLFDDLMQPQQGIAPRDGALLPLVAFDFLQVAFRPIKSIVLNSVSKIDVRKRICRQRLKRYLLAPLRCRVLQLFDDKREEAIQ